MPAAILRACATGVRTSRSPTSTRVGIPSNAASARLVIAPGAGHMLPLERDRLVSDELIGLVTAALTTARDREAVTAPA